MLPPSSVQVIVNATEPTVTTLQAVPLPQMLKLMRYCPVWPHAVAAHRVDVAMEATWPVAVIAALVVFDFPEKLFWLACPEATKAVKRIRAAARFIDRPSR